MLPISNPSMFTPNKMPPTIFTRLGKNMRGAYNKEKQELLRKVDELDNKAETQLLRQHEWDLKQCVKDRLAQLLREEELKWFQRAKTTNILKGDNNTRYFQMVANGKRRKTRILRLEQEEGIVEGNDKTWEAREE
jgi:phage gp29-like protein